MSDCQPPGTIRDRSEAAMVLFARSMQWLVRNPDESLPGFQAWLGAQKWQDRDEDWTDVLQYDADHIGRLIWQIYEML